MKFTLEMDCDNAVFDDKFAKVSRILRELATAVSDDGVVSYKLRDYNGNTVGSARFEPGK